MTKQKTSQRGQFALALLALSLAFVQGAAAQAPQAFTGLTFGAPVPTKSVDAAPTTVTESAGPPVKVAPAPQPAASATAVQPPQKPALKEWSISSADQTLGRALARWAATVPVPLYWEADRERPAIPAVYRMATFEEALEAVMVDTRHSAYVIHACAHDNAIRILHASQACE